MRILAETNTTKESKKGFLEDVNYKEKELCVHICVRYIYNILEFYIKNFKNVHCTYKRKNRYIQ